MTQKLNHVLAVEKNTKGKATREITDLHRDSGKPDLYNGFSKTYVSKDEDGESYPPESKLVQQSARPILKQVQKILSSLFDITYTKDAANQDAKGDIIVDGETLAAGVPPTTLLFVEKQLNDVYTFVSKMPVLDPNFEWYYDEGSSLYKTPAVQTTKTKKVVKALVLHPATKEHPAQTAQVSEDTVVGTWNAVRQSGALKPQEREEILERVEKLQNAVKVARETANSTPAPDKELAARLFGYLFNN